MFNALIYGFLGFSWTGKRARSCGVGEAEDQVNSYLFLAILCLGKIREITFPFTSHSSPLHLDRVFCAYFSFKTNKLHLGKNGVILMLQGTLDYTWF